MELVITIVIYTHAFFGGIGLLAGFASIIYQKGSSNHKLSGTLFSYSMISSSVLSLGICLMPKHHNPFLFLIGIFTIYLVLSGNRILLFKKKTAATFTDKLISGALFSGSILMLSLGVYYVLKKDGIGILYLFFGLLALVLTWRDYKFYKTLDKSKILKLHMGKMTGAFTASITAFLVAGIQLNGMIYWILPSLLSGVFISYWSRRIGKTKNQNNGFTTEVY